MKIVRSLHPLGFIMLISLSNALVAQNNMPSFLNHEVATAFTSIPVEMESLYNNVDPDSVRNVSVVNITDPPDNTKVENINAQTDAPSSGTINLDNYMELDVVNAINSIFHLNSILFDYNDARLTQSSKKVLDKVAYIMLKNPKVVFELGAHTDARGIYRDNIVLSRKRVNSAIKYLTAKGVNEIQLVGVAYGERILKNVCDSDSHCSKELHASNRRLEIKIISIVK